VKRKSPKPFRWVKAVPRKLRVLWRALKKFNDDNGFLLSSGIAFNLVICLIPLILLTLAFIGTSLYSDREVLGHIRRYLENLIPSLDPRIMKNILVIVRDRNIVGVVGIGGLVWASTWVFSAIRTALNMIFQVKKGQGILHGKAVDLLMVLLAGTLFLASMFLSSGVAFVRASHSSFLLGTGGAAKFLLRYIIPFFFTFGMFFLIYEIVPNRRVRVKTAYQAALFTSLLWEAAKQFFGWYVLHLARFSVVYGSLATLAVFFFWIYYSAVILLLGGEIAFFLEKREAP
jgi:membrane protein